jgi:hypothetical protein
MLEPDSVEQEWELELEQAPVEIVTNHSLEQGKTRCILPIFLDFNFAK